MIDEPILRGLLEALPAPGQPFPRIDDWLDLFRAYLDYLYPAPPKPLPAGWGQPTCPKCGGPKGVYSTQCIKCNRGTEGNRGGVGGDTRSPEVRDALAEAKTTGGPVVIRPFDLSDTDRQQLSVALRNGASPGRLVAIATAKPDSALPEASGLRSGGITLHPTPFKTCPEAGCGKRVRAGWDRCKAHRGQPGTRPVPVVGAWPAPAVAGHRIRPGPEKFDRCPECEVNTKPIGDARCGRCQELKMRGVRPAGVRSG